MKNKIIKVLYTIGFIFTLSSCLSIDTNAVSESLNEYEEDVIVMSSSGDWRVLRDAEELTNSSSHVIRAEVIDSRVESRNLSTPVDISIERARRNGREISEENITAMRNNPVRYTIVTINRLKVIESFKGHLETGEIIEMMQRGGILDGYDNYKTIMHNGVEKRVSVATSHHSVPLYEGDDLIFFLHLWEDRDSPYVIVQPFQGVHRFVEPIPSNFTRDMNIELENVHPRSNFTITVQDLINIAEANFPIDNSEDEPSDDEIISREALILAIQEAEEKIQTMYTQISWARLQNLLRDARNVYNNLEATQLEIDDVTNNLRVGLATLVPLNLLDDLDVAISHAQSLNQPDFTRGSWVMMQEVLQLAISLASLEDNPKVIESVTNDLWNAINRLVLVEIMPQLNFEWLDELIERAETREATGLDGASRINWILFTEALNAARAVRSNQNVTSADIDNAASTLYNALSRVMPIQF